MLQILEKIEKKIDKEIESSKLKSQGDNIEVLVDIVITHQDAQLEWNTLFQVHILLEIIL
jgi:hypothetical protein